ncbi:MAG: hypothetical protein JW786_15310 [Desulfobacterales bacterium]|nr:hypothetical protein [Desulfobacterales bacterium]
MENFFEKRIIETKLYNFNANFEERSIPIEIRTDRFTQRVSRVLKFRMRFPEAFHDPELIERSKKNCPFCPQNIESSTPKFPSSIVPEGRIRYGNSVVIPNAFPYSRYCSVTIISEEHYVPLDRFSSQTLFDALKASHIFIDRIQKNVTDAAYASINWNYMPAAGGGLIHPHFQAVVNQKPTSFHNKLRNASSTYRQSNASNFWSDLVTFEKQVQSRYLFNSGNIEFISSFSPGGMFGEILAVFKEMKSIKDITAEVWRSFSNGLIRILRCFNRLHLDNLNMTLLLSLEDDKDFWIQARIIPRLTLPPWGTSDINYFEKGHDEIIVIMSPEDLAEEIRSTK